MRTLLRPRTGALHFGSGFAARGQTRPNDRPFATAAGGEKGRPRREPKRRRPFLGRAQACGFTVLELLVAISVLTLIVLLLYGLFDQVQKALRSNVAQVDVLEGGRSAMQLLSSEMEQMAPANIPRSTNLYIRWAAPPYEQALLDANEFRANVLHKLFFLTHSNKSWTATAYKVLVFTNDAGNRFKPLVEPADRVGSLGRYSIQMSEFDFANTNFSAAVMTYLDQTLTNYQRVTDGLVHFRVRAFDSNGLLITNSFNTNIVSGVKVTPGVFNDGVEYAYAFTNKALPSYLEVEMGVLDPHILERMKAMPPPAAARYYSNQAGAVHLFQQRIPIRAGQ